MAQGYYGTESNPLANLHSERVVLTPHTSGEPGQYGMRLRTDLNSGDRIATVLVNNGTVGEAPVFPDGASTPSGIAEGPPVYVPGEGWGFIPIQEQGGTFEEYVIWHNGTRHGVHSSLFVIPDSAINRWPIQAGSGTTVTDVIGSSDGSINGATWQSDANAIDSWTLSFDGANDTGQVSPYNTNIFDGGGAFAFTAEFSTFSSTQICWSKGDFASSATNLDWYSGLTDEGAELRVEISDGSNDIVVLTYDTANLSTGTKYRIVINWDGTTNTDTAELWVNNSSVATTTATGTSPANAHSTLWFGGEEGQDATNFYSSNTHDEAIAFDSAATASEIADDYNRQPWS